MLLQARMEEHSHPIHPAVGQVQLLLGTTRLLPVLSWVPQSCTRAKLWSESGCCFLAAEPKLKDTVLKNEKSEQIFPQKHFA